MEDGELRSPPLSRRACHVFSVISRRGGTMRVGPLLDAARLPPDDLADAINELAQRYWVNINWRNPGAPVREHLPERFRKVERITTTRFGRFRYSVTWPSC